MTDKKDTKTPEEIMFPEAKIGNITVKPWSFGQLIEVSALLERVLDKAEKKGIDFNNMEALFDYGTVARLFTLASKELLELIALTINKDLKEVKALNLDEGILIAVTIARQNGTLIKNVLSPLLPEPEEGESVEENETPTQ